MVTDIAWTKEWPTQLFSLAGPVSQTGSALDSQVCVYIKHLLLSQWPQQGVKKLACKGLNTIHIAQAIIFQVKGLIFPNKIQST